MMYQVLLLLVAIFSPSALSHEESAVAISNANNKFTVDLYRGLLSEDKENMIFSPLGVHTVMSMLYQGADGTTKGALQTSLHLDEPAAVAEGYSHLMTQLNNMKNVTLYSANKIYINKKFQMLPEFENAITGKFQSDVENIDFKNSSMAAGQINGWVNTKTMGKIKQLFKADDFSEDTRLALLNAIYFKGFWKNKFKKGVTTPRDFYLNRTHSITVDMMYSDGGYNMKNDTDLQAQVIEIPFKGNGVSLYVILPQEDTDIANTERRINQLGVSKIFENMNWQKHVRLYLPKFKLETQIDLMAPLKSAGLGIIFDRQKCNLLKMLNLSPLENLYIDKAVQKTFFEVNEEGAEAAAATGARVVVAYGKPATPTFFADHPFLVILKQSDNVLFYGKIVNPFITQVMFEEKASHQGNPA